MDERKRCLISNMIDFLHSETSEGNLTEDQKESIEVSIQCLESAFDMDEATRRDYPRHDLLAQVEAPMSTEARKAEAEKRKAAGNSNMKASKHTEAVEEYTEAIRLDGSNPVYYCNRAAAYSKLEKHLLAIDDCRRAIELDPTYGKAYGRLGIAYSNLNRFEEARRAYSAALERDPGNAMYETNMKLAEERMMAGMESAAPPEHTPVDISQFMNNPNLISMATQMLGDSTFRNLISGLMSSGQFLGDPNFNTLMQVGHTLAYRMRDTDPNFVENLRRTLDPEQQQQQQEQQQQQSEQGDNVASTTTTTGADNSNNVPEEKKD